jgi:hypothetical protein
VVSLMTNCCIAVIAEDATDCNAIREIVHRVLGTSISTKMWSAKGCSTLRGKLSAKLELMSKGGCNAFVIIHDLDRNPENNSLNDETILRKRLETTTSKIPAINKHICIPIEELEAWFWSDPKVVEHIGQGKGKAHSNPHLIIRPKDKLRDLSIGENRKPRYSTNMNDELARMLNLDLCSARCPSFRYLLDFLQSL